MHEIQLEEQIAFRSSFTVLGSSHCRSPPTQYSSTTSLFQVRISCRSLLRLEVVQQHVSFLALLTPVADNHARAVDNLSRVSFSVENAQSSPLAQHLSIWNLNERDLVLGAEGNDKFLVCFFLAAFVQDAHVCLAAIEGFAGFTEAARETVVD